MRGVAKENTGVKSKTSSVGVLSKVTLVLSVVAESETCYLRFKFVGRVA